MRCQLCTLKAPKWLSDTHNTALCYCNVLLLCNVPVDRQEAEFYVGVGVSVNEWTALCVWVCVFKFGVPDWNHVRHLKGLVCVTFPLLAQCSTFLAQMNKKFVFSYTTQILAKAVILVYLLRTMNRTAELESSWDVQKWYTAQNIVTAHPLQ